MKILVIEPEKNPVVKEIDGELESMQKVVGGSIEAVYPFDDMVALVVNEEGKLMDLPWNRLVINNDRVADVLVGTCFICGIGEEDFCSLTDELVQKYQKVFGLDGNKLMFTGHGIIPCVEL